jgi:hypothetical protein
MIEVRCPNGHRLRVSAQHAGKLGRCRRCQARVRIPAPRFSEDDILGILGPPPSSSTLRHAASAAEVLGEQTGRGQKRNGHTGQTAAKTADSSVIRQQRLCPNCGRMASFTFKWCPGCGARLGEHSVRRREQAASE